MPRQNVTESEYELMKILWSSKEAMTIGEIHRRLPESESKWSKNTVATLLVRLSEKNIIAYDKKGKYHYYYPVLRENEYSLSETKSFLSKMFGGSVKNMMASLYSNKELSKEEIDELREFFDLEK